MKYDRPVWQIMHECADAMPEVFRYEDVRDWFSRHYPEVNEATIRAHLIGLTEGGRAKHVQFAQRSPVFTRVARGEYAPIPVAERGEDPHAGGSSTSKLKMKSGDSTTRSPVSAASTPPETEPGEHESGEAELADPDIVLVGSVGDRVNVPAPAREMFRDPSFQLSRLEAEHGEAEWFILSAEHGLLAPGEWMSPDSRTLADLDPDYRVAWAHWVVARLASMSGSLDDRLVRVDAPDDFIGPLFAALQEAGAVVASGNVGVGVPLLTARSATESALGAQLADTLEDARTDDEPRRLEGVVIPSDDDTADEPVPDEPVADMPASEEPVADEPASEEPAAADEHGPQALSLYLADVRNAIPASQASELPDSPGFYGWFVDPLGARELNRCLMLPVRAGLIFVGQIGGSSWQSLADPVLNLRDHVERIQLHGRARASTFRMTLATVLRDHLGMTSLEDPRLTDWMLAHLSISCWPSDELGTMREIEQLVIAELTPPLNVDQLPASEYRARLQQMRLASG